MTEERTSLITMLVEHYKRGGWAVKISDGILEAAGPGGVTWLGRAVTPDDFQDDSFEAEIIDLAERRMERGGELCPLDLLPHAECEPDLRELLERTGLDRRPHVSVYSLAA